MKDSNAEAIFCYAIWGYDDGRVLWSGKAVGEVSRSIRKKLVQRWDKGGKNRHGSYPDRQGTR